MKSGVKLLLEPRTRIPIWIRNQSLNVTVERVHRAERMLRVLTIRKGKALYIPSGAVAVKMPGSEEFWVAFTSSKILEIRDLRNALVQRNWYLCDQCWYLAGEVQEHKWSPRVGLRDVKFKCSHCGNTWERKGI